MTSSFAPYTNLFVCFKKVNHRSIIVYTVK